MADQDTQQRNQQGQQAHISGTVTLDPPDERRTATQARPQDPVPMEEEIETPETKHRRNAIIIAVVVVLVCLAGFFYWRSTLTEDTDDAQVDGDLYQVSSRVAGQVIKVYVEDNQTVHAGDPIADIDPKDLQVALEQAEANLANAQAEYTQQATNVPITQVNVRTSVTTAGSDVLGSQAGVLQAQQQEQAAQARIQQARANAAKAQSDVDRYTPLVQKDVISKQQYDAAVAAAQAAAASVDEAQKQEAAQREVIRNAQQRLAQSREQAAQSRQNASGQVKVQQARAQAASAAVQQAQARVDQAKLNLSYAHIVSPVNGIVNKKNVSVGANLSVGQDLLTIVPLDNLWVTANFKETQLRGLQKDQVVDLKVDALGGRHFKGKVTQIGGATGSRLSLFPPENATGNYVKVVQRIPVRIDFTNLAEENKDEALRPGMSVVPDVHVK